MSQNLTIAALIALALALLLLILYFRAEARDIARDPGRHPIPGKYFITILLLCTVLGMIITEWQGICSLSSWGFVTGVLFGLAAEIIIFAGTGKKNAGRSG